MMVSAMEKNEGEKNEEWEGRGSFHEAREGLPVKVISRKVLKEPREQAL